MMPVSRWNAIKLLRLMANIPDNKCNPTSLQLPTTRQKNPARSTLTKQAQGEILLCN